MEKTSWKERVGERPRLWRRVDMRSGLFSEEVIVSTRDGSYWFLVFVSLSCGMLCTERDEVFLLCGGHGGCVGVVDGHDALMGFSDLTRKKCRGYCISVSGTVNVAGTRGSGSEWIVV